MATTAEVVKDKKKIKILSCCIQRNQSFLYQIILIRFINRMKNKKIIISDNIIEGSISF